VLQFDASSLVSATAQGFEIDDIYQRAVAAAEAALHSPDVNMDGDALEAKEGEEPLEGEEPQGAAQAAGGSNKRTRVTDINQRLKKMYRQRKSLAGKATAPPMRPPTLTVCIGLGAPKRS